MFYNQVSFHLIRYLIRKDIIYPSRYNYTLPNLKQKLNHYGLINNFRGIFLEITEKKLLRLARNCENYDDVQS